MYIDGVNELIMECCVIENASIGGGIYGKVVKASGGVGGEGEARGSISGANSANDSLNREDAIKPKNRA